MHLLHDLADLSRVVDAFSIVVVILGVFALGSCAAYAGFRPPRD